MDVVSATDVYLGICTIPGAAFAPDGISMCSFTPAFHVSLFNLAFILPDSR